jgi:hypothetical protein
VLRFTSSRTGSATLTRQITLRVYAHVIRQRADDAAIAFATAVDGESETDTPEGHGKAAE